MTKTISFLFFLLLGFGVFPQQSICQEAPGAADVRISIKAEKQPLGLIFRELMQKYQIDIGFEQSSLDNGKGYFAFDTNMPESATHRSRSTDGYVTIELTSKSGFRAGPFPISLDIMNGSVVDVFNAIVPQMGNYEWRMRDGVVNIYPIRGSDPRFEDLLDIKVNHFSVAKGSKVEDIITTILDLPEFMQFERKYCLTFSPIREGSVTLVKAQYGRPVVRAIEFKNIRFRDLLNRITKIKKGGWILKVTGKTREGGDLGDLDI